MNDKNQPDSMLPQFILEPDISGDDEPPEPEAATGKICECCGYPAARLWQGARSALSEPHHVCTLCYLTGHMDSPSAALGRLAWLPGLPITDVIHLQRRALIAATGGDKSQRREGRRILLWLFHHARETELAWGSAHAGEFARAMRRLAPARRASLRRRLTGCALIMPPDTDALKDLSLLLPAGKTVEAVLRSRNGSLSARSNSYDKCPDTLG